MSIEAEVDTGTVVAQALGNAAQNGTVYRATPGVLSVTPDLKSASNATCYLSEQGLVTCWGDDSVGLVREAPSGFYKRLAMGSQAGCVLHDEGFASCWGDPGTGLSGILDEPLIELVDVGVGLNAACGLRESDGSAVCWGNTADAVYTGMPGTTGLTGIWATAGAACARDASGLLDCWGDDANGEVSGVPILPVLSVAAGSDHFCALMADGSIDCWGADTSGETIPPAGVGFLGVAAGGAHSCAIDDVYAAVCWGADGYGQVSTTPQPPTWYFGDITAGDRHSCGSAADGTLICWGANDLGQLNIPPY